MLSAAYAVLSGGIERALLPSRRGWRGIELLPEGGNGRLLSAEPAALLPAEFAGAVLSGSLEVLPGGCDGAVLPGGCRWESDALLPEGLGDGVLPAEYAVLSCRFHGRLLPGGCYGGRVDLLSAGFCGPVLPERSFLLPAEPSGNERKGLLPAQYQVHCRPVNRRLVLPLTRPVIGRSWWNGVNALEALSKNHCGSGATRA